MKKKIYLYRLIDAKGNQDLTVVNNLSDNGTIGGYDKNGNYQQYDSYELYHAYDWAKSHGMKLDLLTTEIDIDSLNKSI